MIASDLVTLLPLLIIASAAAILLLLLAFIRNHKLTFVLTLGVLGLAFGTLFIPPVGDGRVTPLLRMDPFAHFFIGLGLLATFVVAIFSYGYLDSRTMRPDELYVLLLLGSLGASVLAASVHFASFFLGLEILSISLYALISYVRASEHGVEAGIKYLVLAGASSGFLLFGMALIYAETGTMEFSRITGANAGAGGTLNLVMLTGLVMMMVGIGFKLAVVPFHLWTPDVYQGAPTPVTAFVASVSKGGMFALLLRFFGAADLPSYRSIILALILISVASMIGGNLLALLQNNVKRILAYSSIAHIGYLLVALVASGPLATTAVGFYLVSYFVTTLGAFGVVTLLSSEGEAEDIDAYRGLFARRPWLAIIFGAMLLSLAGIPLTSGFVGKFYLVAAGASAEQWLLILVLVLTSAIGLFYYLRIIVAMFVQEPLEYTEPLPRRPMAATIMLVVLAIFLVGLGVYPSPLLDFLQVIMRV